MSDALRRTGFQVYPIDHSANRYAPKVKVFVMDVSNSDQLALLISMLHHCKPCHIHMGLPCGTCSRAREKPMPSRLGVHMGPQALRNAGNLMGIKGLSGADQLKVELANALYRAAITILETCMALGCFISIENPARSWLWALLAFLIKETGNTELISWYGKLESVYFDACAHGSSRDKRTKLLATEGLFSSLARDCPRNHTHASWQPYKDEHGVHFPTAAEAEYPKLLCDRMAQCILTAAATKDVVPKINPKLKDLLKQGMGHQNLKHSPLIPEYKCYMHTEREQSNEAYKLIAAPFSTGIEDTEQPGPSEPQSKRPRNMFKYGVWHSPEEFLQRASQVIHPMVHDSVVH